MSSTTVSQLCMEKGHFLKLIDSFAWEIGTLKKEMGKKGQSWKKDRKSETSFGQGEEVGGLFMQASPHSRICTNLAGARDSGYDSFHRQLCILDRVVYTHPVWLLLSLSYKEATRILQNQPSGMFVVRKSASLQKKVISLRMGKDSPVPIKEFPVKESQYTFALEGSGLSFADLFRLVAFSCISRDVLPITLKLPEVIASAKTSADLEEVSKLGPGFWDTQLNHEQRGVGPLPWKATPRRPPFPAKRPVSWTTSIGCPKLQTRTPAELDCYQSNGALCFINPLFIKSNQSHQDLSGTATGVEDKPVNNLGRNRKEDPCSSTSPEASNLEPSDRTEPHNPIKTTQVNKQKPEPATCHKLGAFSSSPPPRPPPPRFGSRRSVPPVRQCSMPEKISWIGASKDRTKETTRECLTRLGSSLSISPSSSPPRKPIISFPISTPKLSPPRSLSFLSSSPRQSKISLSSSLEDAALEEQTIEKALHRAKLFQNSCRKNVSRDADGSPPQCSVMSRTDQTDAQQEDVEPAGESSCGGQRLSDMSLSTDSSDSLDFSGTFSIPPFHDPSPPTEDELNTYLPLSLPSSHLLYSSIDDDEDDEDEEDPDYGVNLEADQDQEVTMVPPGHRISRRSSASALVIQQALRGQLRKMSGVFNSLLTPEKRVVRKVVELSRDKGSYFGCLVQDYLSYMGEGAGTQAWQGYTSGLELLQTLRQFMTQMKSYLRQSSEMEPPIESLIPEEQIDQVLEKSMHKCVLKPLKSVLSTALQEIQVRSGAWRELKENLALAKARKPQEMGVAAMQPLDPVALDKIKQKFQTMCKLYSPEKKVTMLLRVCKLIYTMMEDNSGRLFGADDFLPMLTYILAKCDMPELDNEILYMMELLDPSQLHGEGGYYLTSAYGAMSLIRNFQEEQAARVLSSETRDTLCQWHRRRTAQRSAPSIDDFQNYLRVALQELDSGCTAKTLQVRPYATVEEVCQLCALKFKVSEPEKYGLFLLIEGSSQQLAPDTHPQKIKAELLSRPQPPPFHFVFRRVASNVPQKLPASGFNAPNNNSTTTDVTC